MPLSRAPAAVSFDAEAARAGRSDGGARTGRVKRNTKKTRPYGDLVSLSGGARGPPQFDQTRRAAPS
jgi:hypothetical protein